MAHHYRHILAWSSGRGRGVRADRSKRRAGMREVKNRVRKNLKNARQKAGMTQKDMAEYLGMTERAYQRIESGERLGTIETWDSLEDLFNTHQRKLREGSSD